MTALKSSHLTTTQSRLKAKEMNFFLTLFPCSKTQKFCACSIFFIFHLNFIPEKSQTPEHCVRRRRKSGKEIKM